MQQKQAGQPACFLFAVDYSCATSQSRSAAVSSTASAPRALREMLRVHGAEDGGKRGTHRAQVRKADLQRGTALLPGHSLARSLRLRLVGLSNDMALLVSSPLR